MYPIAIKRVAQKRRDLFSEYPEYYANVPCGRCPECKARTQASWAFRCIEQLNDLKTGPIAGCITLTYAPIFEKEFTTELGLLTTRKVHIQKWIKRVRKLCGKRKQKIKYFAVSEYGSLSFRPHYHVLVWGATEDELEECWGYGMTSWQPMNEQAIRYTLKYLDKDDDDYWDERETYWVGDIEKYVNDDREKPTRYISQGIGKSFLIPEVRKAIKDGRLWMVPLGHGMICTPRYYLDAVFGDDHWIMEKKYLSDRAKGDREYLDAMKTDYYLHMAKKHPGKGWEEKGTKYDEMRRGRAKAKESRFKKIVMVIREPKIYDI